MNGRHGGGVRLAIAACAALAVQLSAQTDARSAVSERVTRLTRESSWRRVATIPIGFATYHPQGMAKVGDVFYVSSVEVRTPTRRFLTPAGGYDRDAGEGVGHLFTIDRTGRLIADLVLGEQSIYHPGGIDYDGRHLWVPVSEYRPNSRSIVYRIDPHTMKASEVLRVADHIGAIVHDTDDDSLHGVSWGSRRLYRWRLDRAGKAVETGASAESLRTLNPSHYIDYQDCKYVARSRMLCTGVAEYHAAPGGPPFRLGGLELIDLRSGRPLHQVPVPLWTAGGLDMTHNPVWIESHEEGLRAYFMPEDDRSTIYVFDVD